MSLRKTKKKLVELDEKAREFITKHKNVINSLNKLRREYALALEAYKKDLRKYVVDKDLPKFVDNDTGIFVVQKKPAVTVRSEDLVSKYGWVKLSKYLDKVVTYKPKDDSALERMVADGVLSLSELHQYIEEKERKPAVTVPAQKKDILPTPTK